MPQTIIEEKDTLTMPVKIILFLSSYIPLYIIIAVLKNQNPNIFWFFISLSGLILLLLFAIYFGITRVSGDYLQTYKIENTNKSNIEYLVTYILPFLNNNLSDINNDIALIIFFLLIGFLYINSDMLYFNPVLNLAGFNIFKATVNDSEVIIITRKSKSIINSTEVVKIGSSIYIGK